MDTQKNTEDGQETVVKNSYWCNFCGYTSDNLQDYLAHSCIEVLEASGKKAVKTGQNECR